MDRQHAIVALAVTLSSWFATTQNAGADVVNYRYVSSILDHSPVNSQAGQSPATLQDAPDGVIVEFDNVGSAPGYVIVAFDGIVTDYPGQDDLVLWVFDFDVPPRIDPDERFYVDVSIDGISFSTATFVDQGGPDQQMTTIGVDIASAGLSYARYVRLRNASVDTSCPCEGPDLDAIAAVGCWGDLDGDLDTDVFDFGRFASSFGNSVPPGTGGDLDGSSVVDVFDFPIFASDFGCGTE